MANSLAAIRAGGFYVVTISDLRQGLLVLYGESRAILCAMYSHANNLLVLMMVRRTYPGPLYQATLTQQ